MIVLPYETTAVWDHLKKIHKINPAAEKLPSFRAKTVKNMLKSTACLPKNYMTAFVLSFFGSSFLPWCNSEHKTAAARWQLWTFHLPVISQWSESSVCLSEPSLCLTSAASLVCSHWHHPAALFFLSPRLDSIRGEIFWWEVSSRWLGCSCSLLSAFRSSKVCI